MTYEGIRLKLLEIRRKTFARRRENVIHNRNFTIISNNCWGGMVYEWYNFQKNSPTVGLFFMASDYIKFLARIKEYLTTEIVFIKPETSRYKDFHNIVNDKRFGSYPIGTLTLKDGESIELFFLHYHSEDEAKHKWQKRCLRINWDKLLIKFNDQNGCTEEHIDKFVTLPFKNKLFFTCKKWKKENVWKKQLKGRYCYIKQHLNNDYIKASHEPFGKNRYINVNNVINDL